MSGTPAAAGRKYIDCSEYPSDTNCTLRISGKEDEVLSAAAQHAAQVHGHEDTAENRNELRKMLKNE